MQSLITITSTVDFPRKALLWHEYCETAYANGEKLYKSTQLGDKYRQWTRITKATMRVTHKPGDTM